MAKKLFIGNLPYTVNDEQLKDIFKEAGNVEAANVVTDKFSGRSRGFGFVEMSSEEEVKKAVEELNEKEVDGRKIVVNEARPKKE